MRTLKFIVDNLVIKPDPSCDFTGLVPDTEEYLQAEFSFSPEWNDYVKVAEFTSRLGREYPPQILEDGKTCIVPAAALKKRYFNIKILGKKDEKKMITNKVTVDQNGG